MKQFSAWLYIIGISVVLFFVVIKCESMFKNSSKSDDSEVNLQNTTEIQNYLQGKWNLTYYPSGGLTIHINMLIEGNTIKTWSAVNDHNNENDYVWDMTQPPSETYNFRIGELTAKDTKRYIEWDDNGDLTMEQRAIGSLFVAKSGFHHGAGAYVVERGWDE